jgi:hypothetical protein
LAALRVHVISLNPCCKVIIKKEKKENPRGQITIQEATETGSHGRDCCSNATDNKWDKKEKDERATAKRVAAACISRLNHHHTAYPRIDPVTMLAISQMHFEIRQGFLGPGRV